MQPSSNTTTVRQPMFNSETTVKYSYSQEIKRPVLTFEIVGASLCGLRVKEHIELGELTAAAGVNEMKPLGILLSR